MLGATDGHAKNFSIFVQPGGAYKLTPLYDVLSAYPVIGQGKGKLPRQKAHLAMKVRGSSAHSQLDYVKPRHWVAEAARSGVPGMLTAMIRLAAGAARAIATVESELPNDFPERVWTPVVTGLTAASQAFLAGAELAPDAGD